MKGQPETIKYVCFNFVLDLKESHIQYFQAESLQDLSVISFLFYFRAVFGKNKILDHKGQIDPSPVHFYHEDNGNNLYFSEIR